MASDAKLIPSVDFTSISVTDSNTVKCHILHAGMLNKALWTIFTS